MNFIVWEPSEGDFGSLRLREFSSYDEAVRYVMEGTPKENRHFISVSGRDGMIISPSELQERYLSVTTGHLPVVNIAPSSESGFSGRFRDRASSWLGFWRAVISRWRPANGERDAAHCEGLFH